MLARSQRLVVSAIRPRLLPWPKCYSTENPIIECSDGLVDPACDPSNPKKLLFAQISTAAYNIRDAIKPTECRLSKKLSRDTGIDIFLKMELNQVTGSFKERGACWALMKTKREDPHINAWAASSGNHALALSYHGRRLGITINVVMPLNAALNKVNSCMKLGANVILKGEDMGITRKLALKMALENNGKLINGYDHIDIIAGVGTIGLEILEQVKNLDAILIPIGGGGLLAGVSLAIKTLYPNVEIIGVESEACPSFMNALEKGQPTLIEVRPTLADGLNVPIAGNRIDNIVTVSEQELCVAILRLMENEKIVVEGAGAAGVAALMSGKLEHLKGKRVATIITGGNIDSTVLGRAIERGLVFDGRLIRFRVVVSDRPGGIAELTKNIADLRASIKDISVSRAWLRQDVFSVAVKIVAEVRDGQHAHELETVLRSKYEDITFHFYGEE